MRLAALDLTAAETTALHTVPAGHRAVVTVNLCNRNHARAMVRVAITAGDDPTSADWIEYDTPLPPVGSTGGSTMQITGLALAASQSVYVHANVADVSAVVHGVQEVI